MKDISMQINNDFTIGAMWEAICPCGSKTFYFFHQEDAQNILECSQCGKDIQVHQLYPRGELGG